jgi:hypothetical protein
MQDPAKSPEFAGGARRSGQGPRVGVEDFRLADGRPLISCWLWRQCQYVGPLGFYFACLCQPQVYSGLVKASKPAWSGMGKRLEAGRNSACETLQGLWKFSNIDRDRSTSQACELHNSESRRGLCTPLALSVWVTLPIYSVAVADYSSEGDTSCKKQISLAASRPPKRKRGYYVLTGSNQGVIKKQ